MADEPKQCGAPWPTIFDPEFEPNIPGTPLAPTQFIPMEPEHEEALGALLGHILHDEPEHGPPYVHTFRPPEPIQDENGEWWTPIEPSFTLAAHTDYDLAMCGVAPELFYISVGAQIASASHEPIPAPPAIRWSRRAHDAIHPA